MFQKFWDIVHRFFKKVVLSEKQHHRIERALDLESDAMQVVFVKCSLMSFSDLMLLSFTTESGEFEIIFEWF